MTRRYVLCGFLLTGLACQTATTTTFYIVRHSEKVDMSDESGLTELGQARAADLAQQLANRRIRRVYATRFRRTQLTAEPTALQHDLEVTPATPSASELLRRHRGQAVLIAGHANTVPKLLKNLGVDEKISLAKGDYGDLFVVTVTRGEAKLERRRFGDPPIPPGPR